MIDTKSIINLSEISEFIGKWEGDCLLLIRSLLLDPTSHILSHRDKTIYFILEGKSNKVAVMHIYCDRKSRGRKMLDFIKEVKEWGKENTEIEYVFNYTNDSRVKLLMGHLGSKRIGDFRGQTVFKQTIKR